MKVVRLTWKLSLNLRFKGIYFIAIWEKDLGTRKIKRIIMWSDFPNDAIVCSFEL
ncbi:hypothetical protein FD04_GL000739 [Secundilactobacillus odoratitofui DSM 19909 = JCM 15043]|uniref:Uncharacterized protein n=1 Tax=Secundilactobacillus odoratitofui DSM 19909 = JCM 15043 TaxID=1423776 RepID=A0A0R1LXX3_9LACO|nr:hypothetical protein FD04_GL000739 [Secundilactobacillus odoratitofui DSM 19909 = JCM 15043]